MPVNADHWSDPLGVSSGTPLDQLSGKGAGDRDAPAASIPLSARPSERDGEVTASSSHLYRGKPIEWWAAMAHELAGAIDGATAELKRATDLLDERRWCCHSGCDSDAEFSIQDLDNGTDTAFTDVCREHLTEFLPPKRGDVQKVGSFLGSEEQ